MNAPGFARYLEILFRYVLQVFDIPKDDLGNLVTGTIKRDVKELLMTTYERLIQEGELIGANRVLTRLLAKRFQQDLGELTPLLKGLSGEREEELIEKILQSGSLQEIIDWLKSVGRNQAGN